MAGIDEERQLWRVGEVECVLRSCCSGAELQLRRTDAASDGAIVLRELYPTKSDLYERARQLETDYRTLTPAGDSSDTRSS